MEENLIEDMHQRIYDYLQQQKEKDRRCGNAAFIS